MILEMQADSCYEAVIGCEICSTVPKTVPPSRDLLLMKAPWFCPGFLQIKGCLREAQ